MIQFYKTPWLTRKWYSNFVWSLPDQQSIYLTFDDGPHPEVTPWVIEQLNEFNAKATFFCIGKNLSDYPELGKELIYAGHTLGNHTEHHLNGWKTTNKTYEQDINQCDLSLEKLGIRNQLFRPPYGRIRKSQQSRLKERKIIMWSHLSWDFKEDLNVKKSITRLQKAKPGSILVFHDSVQAFHNLKIILPEILKHFTLRGLKFETLK